MPNKHIDEFLDYYNKLGNPQYAVLLKGKWGSGKTHFINNYKDHLDKIDQKYIYVSLYGVTSYDAIETEFLKAIHPKLYNDKTIFAGKIVKGLLKGTLKLDFDDDGKADGSVNVQIPSFKLEDILNTKDRILIFDDLERCSINIVDLMGYINYFVEHQSYKVILIANEEELEKTEKYKEIKEKLVGKTFEFKTNIDQAYDSFVKELNDEKVLKKYKSTVIEIFEKSKCNNLRLLRQGLFDFIRVYDLVVKEYEKKEEFIKDFIKYYFIFIFETRSGECISIEDLIENLTNYDYWDDLSFQDTANALGMKKENEKEKTVFDKIYDKYKVDVKNKIILNLETWKELIEDSYINIEKINDEILKSKYFIDENTESWKRLWSFWTLNDENFDVILNDVLNNLEQCQYKNLTQVMLIASTVLDIKRENLTNKNLDELYAILKKQIDYIFENKLIEKKSILNGSYIRKHHPAYDNLRFDVNFSEYEEIKKYIDTKVKEEKEIIFANSFYELEDSIKNDSSNLYILLSHSSHEETLYCDKPIFAFMNMDKLAKLLIESSSITQHRFGGIIEERYKHGIFTSKLEDEFENIRTLKELIEKEANAKEGKISGYRLKTNLLKPFEKAIEYIQKYQNAQNKILQHEMTIQ